jgi:hypothetical protein
LNKTKRYRLIIAGIVVRQDGSQVRVTFAQRPLSWAPSRSSSPVGIETLGKATKLRAPPLLDDVFQTADFAVAMCDRGGDIANELMKRCCVCRRIATIELRVRFLPER